MSLSLRLCLFKKAQKQQLQKDFYFKKLEKKFKIKLYHQVRFFNLKNLFQMLLL